GRMTASGVPTKPRPSGNSGSAGSSDSGGHEGVRLSAPQAITGVTDRGHSCDSPGCAAWDRTEITPSTDLDRSPVEFADPAFEKLARTGGRQGVDELEVPGHLVGGQPLPQIGDDLVDDQFGPLGRHDHGIADLAPFLVGDSDDRTDIDSAVAVEFVLHLGGVD